MSDKPKYPRAEALAVANILVQEFAGWVERITIAGSLRRGKPTVGDVELVLIPMFEPAKVSEDFFNASPEVNRTEERIKLMCQFGTIKPRPNINGSIAWGAKNKLAVHCASGIPVDLFLTTAEAWFNYLVCRTGGAENNVRIASAAKKKGWMWHPYGSGYTDNYGNDIKVTSERDVFELVGLPYLEPEQR